MKFNQRLAAILEQQTAGGRSLCPAIIITARGVEIKADHARWFKAKNHIFLAAGLDPTVIEQVARNSGGVLRQARDFFAAPRYLPTSRQDQGTGWADLKCSKCKFPKYMHDLDGLPCDGYEPGTRYDAHRLCLKRQRFRKIITIRKENVRSVQWLD